MKAYRNASINTKLTLLVMLAGGVALLCSCVAFVASDYYVVRSSMVQQMTALASVLGANSTAALTFHDEQTAEEVLNSLQAQPDVEFACIYDAAGRAFALYQRQGMLAAPPPVPDGVGHGFASDGHLEIVQPIEQHGRRIGSIYLQVSMEQLRSQMLRYVNIAAVVMIVSLLASMLMSSWLQRVISWPIHRLAEATERISQDRDYSIRVRKTCDDELGTLYDQFNAMLDQIEEGEAAVQKAHDDLEIKIQQRTAQLSRANQELSREVAMRVRTEKELEASHQQLMAAARNAGMAEIATGVLHNVGNVLNSINVSATLASDRMRQSKVADLARVADLIGKHEQDLAAFITEDAKGKQIPAFLNLLAAHLADERNDVLKELELLATKVDHVKTIVATQQSYAGVAGVIEIVDIGTTLDDALKLNSASFERHKISVIREYADLPPVRIDKQKVLQILVNLMSNAKDAILDSPQCKERKLTLRTAVRDMERLEIQISDNGMGIPAEHLTKIFSHGFTTKKQGHGFGLHSCANAACELGGSLIAKSDGPGRGATFIFELPYEPAAVIL